MFKTSTPCLLIIDVQLAIDEFDSGIRSQPDAEANMQKLLLQWREKHWPVVHVRHSSRFSDSPYHAEKSTFAFKNEVIPTGSEVVVTKRENCAFVGTDLQRLLEQMGVSELVVAGVLINHSVDATIRVAAALGFKVWLVNDATAAFPLTLKNERIEADFVHQIFANNLSGEYCQLTSSSLIIEK